MSAVQFAETFPVGRRGANRARRLTPPERSLYHWILEQFASGQPPSTAATNAQAKLLGLDLGTAAASLARDDLVHLDSAGRPLIAYPFSAVRRGHTVTIGRRRNVEAMCALDALGIAAMLGESTAIDSVDPFSGTPVQVEIEPDGRVEIRPETAVVLVGSSCTAGPSYQTCCDVLNFFANDESAKAHLAGHPEITGTWLPVSEAIELATAIFGDVLADD